MMDFVIRIAKKNILIQSVYSRIQKICKDFVADGDVKPDVVISTNEEMIASEAEIIRKKDGEDPRLPAAEVLLIHRLIAESLLDFDTFLMHGAVVSTGDSAYLFTAQSGTGKTTHVQKWLENIEGSYIVNGDKPLILIDGDKAYACGTPWRGKEDYGTNDIVPLKSIVFMERSTENRIEKVPVTSIFPSLLQQTYQPADADKMRKTLALLMQLKDRVKFYKFYFDNYRDDCFLVSYNELTKN